MEAISIFNNIGTVITLVFGIAAFLVPKRIARGMFFDLNTPRGIAEFRIGMGGAFVGLTVFALLQQSKVLFLALGWFWLGAAIARVACYFIDKPEFNKGYILFFVAEIVVATMLMI